MRILLRQQKQCGFSFDNKKPPRPKYIFVQVIAATTTALTKIRKQQQQHQHQQQQLQQQLQQQYISHDFMRFSGAFWDEVEEHLVARRRGS